LAEQPRADKPAAGVAFSVVMTRTTTSGYLALLSLVLLAGCGGGGNAGSGDPGAGGPPGGATGVTFIGLNGTTPADAALGQPLEVAWMLPAGMSIASVKLEATATAGPSSNPSVCNASAGALAINATSATITIPNTCSGKTVRDVQLRVIVESSAGQQTSATHAYVAPSSTQGFLPLRHNLPVLRITTDNDAPIVSREVYLNGQINLTPNATGNSVVVSATQIRGRGNSTWDLMPKQPYRLKLSDKHDLLGMPSSRDWVLLANYSDKTMLRNTVALELGRNMGMPWTPRGEFVEVYHGGRYLGVYLLMENIKIARDRVNIDELGEDDVGAAEITGGYLLEVDFREDGHTMFSASEHLPIVFQDPEDPAPAQEAYMQGYIDQLENALNSAGFADPATGYAAFIDVDSFVRWYLVNELFRNRDSNMWSSCWMYKPRGGKLHMGPLWDFDIAAGNINYDDAYLTAGWWVRDAPWFSRLFEDPAFVARVREIWNEIRADQLPAMFQSITNRSAALQQAQLNNFQRWPILETYVWPNNRIPGSYAGEVDYLVSWLTARIAWMDTQLNP
jgi:hypothetical protein